MWEYKVVETSDVTAEGLEAILNDMTMKGWRFEGIQFVVKETARRPSMAFVIFVKPLAATKSKKGGQKKTP